MNDEQRIQRKMDDLDAERFGNNLSGEIAWIKAVTAACAEVGFAISMTIHHAGPPPGYSWQPEDGTPYADAWWRECYAHEDGVGPTAEDRALCHAGYVAFHTACVLADRLRPHYIEPSPALRDWLNGDPR